MPPKWITARCSLRDDFNDNIDVFSAYKWRHSDVILIKLTADIQNKISYKMYISDFLFGKIMEWRYFVTYLSNDSRTSGFMDDITFGRNGHDAKTWRLHRRATATSGVAIPGWSLMSMNALLVACKHWIGRIWSESWFATFTSQIYQGADTPGGTKNVPNFARHCATE